MIITPEDIPLVILILAAVTYCFALWFKELRDETRGK